MGQAWTEFGGQYEMMSVGIEAVVEVAASQPVGMVLRLCSYNSYLAEAALAGFCHNQESPNNSEDA